MEPEKLNALVAQAFEGKGFEDAAAILHGLAHKVLWAEVEGLEPEAAKARLDEIKRRSEERKKGGAELLAIRQTERESKNAAKEARKVEWATKSFRWLLEPCPTFFEDTEETRWVPASTDPAEVERIREVAAAWEQSSKRQKLEAWFFDHLSELGFDWLWVVMRENALYIEFVDGVRAAWIDEPAIRSSEIVEDDE